MGGNHICDICGQEFDSGPALGGHVITHSERGHECGICGEEFDTPQALGRHKSTHNSGQYSCEMCDQEFNTASSLGAHKASHDTGPYSCEICGDEFQSLASLAAHKHHHTADYSINYTREELLDEIRGLKKQLGHVPSKRELMELGEYSISTYTQRFGSWSNSVEEAGLDAIEYPATGEDHPDWKGGYFPYGEGWTEEKKREVRERDGNQCVDCGMDSSSHKEKYGVDLHVHHIIPARTFDNGKERNDPENLVTLCILCHRSREKKTDSAK